MRYYFLLASAFALAFGSHAFADEVVFKNGDRLHGNIVKMEKEKLTFRTEATGEISIHSSFIESLSSDQALPVEFKDGNLIKGQLVAETGKISVRTESQQQYHSPVEGVATIGRKKDSWKGKMGANLLSSIGDTVEEKINLSLSLKRPFTRFAEKKHELSFDGKMELRTKNKRLDKRKGRLKGRFDTFFDGRWSWFLEEAVSYDYAKDLQVRLVESVGLSYNFIQRPRFDAWIQLAAQRLDSVYKDAENEGFFSAAPGLDMTWKVWKSVSLENKFRISPSLSHFHDYIWDNDTTLTVPLVKNLDLALKYEMSYDSLPDDEGDAHLDRTAKLELQYNF